MLVKLVLALGTVQTLAITRSHSQYKQNNDPQDKHLCNSDEKEFDIVMFGATGFAGRHAAHYMAHQPNYMKWAMAGRNLQKMQQLRANFKDMAWDLAKATATPIIVADLKNLDSLVKMTMRTRVVLSFAGPFEEMGGENLIKAAITGCAHYIDIAHETHWRSHMMNRYNSAAKERNLAIVQGAGFVSLVPDFLTVQAARDLASDGKGPPNIVYILFNNMNGAESGSGMASAEYALKKYGGVDDPYQLSPHVQQMHRVDEKLEGIKSYGWIPALEDFIFYYPVARMDCVVVRRTMSLLFPNTTISVRGGQSKKCIEHQYKFFIDPRMQDEHPPLKPILGEGPPPWIVRDGGFNVQSVALRFKDNKRTKIGIDGKGDPSFWGTSRLTTHMAMVLASKGNGDRRGFITPALAVDSDELEKSWKGISNGSFVNIIREHLKPLHRNHTE